jgi:hypothetical protein
MGNVVAQLIQELRYNPEDHRFNSDIILPATLQALGLTQPPTNKEYQEYFLWVKAVGG